jgi:hypothetical protein
VLATLQSLCALEGTSEVIQPQRGLFEEPVTSWCWANSGMTPFKEIRPNTMFEVSDTSAHS